MYPFKINVVTTTPVPRILLGFDKSAYSRLIFPIYLHAPVTLTKPIPARRQTEQTNPLP